MARFVRRHSKKHGLPPGSLVFTGEEKTIPVSISVIDYDADTVHAFVAESLDAVLPLRDTPTTSWIDIDGVHDVALLGQIQKHFGIHPLIMEDIVTIGQRPKAEFFDDALFIVLDMHTIDARSGLMQSEQVSLLVGPRWVISFKENPGDVFDPIRTRLRERLGRICSQGSDYLAYTMFDIIVDHYFLVLEAFSDQVETLEEEVLAGNLEVVQVKANAIRRELIHLRRTVWPIRDLISQLERSESPLLTDAIHPYLRDVYDHVVQIIDIVESMRDVLGGLMDLYMTFLSNRMNEIMKFLTVVGTIFIPLTFIAGVYGMNFSNMPELESPYGYPVVWIVMIVIAVGMVFYFKKRKWL